MLKKFFALLLALLMLLPMAVSCSKDEEAPAGESDTVSTASDATDTENPYDENGYIKDSLPELDFGEAEISILSWEESKASDFWAEESSQDLIPNSLFLRNKKVESRLNVKMNATFIAGNYAYRSDFISYVTNVAYSGEESAFDIVGSYSMCGPVLALNGVVIDLYDLKYLDFEKPWWPEQIIDGSELNGALYFATGDISNAYIGNLYCLSVNLNMLKDLKLDDPREMVKNGTWTLDKMIEMTLNVGEDNDGETGKTVGDVYGYSDMTQMITDAWLGATGMKAVKENSEGVLAINEDYMGETIHNLIVKLGTQRHQTDDWCHIPNANIYTDGRSLFGGMYLSWLSIVNQRASFKFGVLPYPKCLDEQDAYYSGVGYPYSNFSIPINAKDPDMSAAVMECMSSESHRGSTPTFFETMVKSRFSNDPIDREMFDMIRAGGVTDIARLYHGVLESSFGWNGTPAGLFRTAVNNGSTTWMSDISGIRAKVDGVLENLSTYTR